MVASHVVVSSAWVPLVYRMLMRNQQPIGLTTSQVYEPGTLMSARTSAPWYPFGYACEVMPLMVQPFTVPGGAPPFTDQAQLGVNTEKPGSFGGVTSIVVVPPPTS